MVMSPNGSLAHALTDLSAFRERKTKSRPVISVAIPELAEPGESAPIVYMQAMSGSRREIWSLRAIAETPYEPDEEVRKRQDRQKTWGEVLRGSKISLVAQSVVAENGRLIFEHAEDELAELNAAAIERMYAKAVQLNGLSRNNIPDYLQAWLASDEVHAAAAPSSLEATLKNSVSAPTDNGSSDSP